MVQAVHLPPQRLQLMVIVRVERLVARRLQFPQLRLDRRLVDPVHGVMLVRVDAERLAQRGKQVILVHLRRALTGIPGDLAKLRHSLGPQLFIRVGHGTSWTTPDPSRFEPVQYTSRSWPMTTRPLNVRPISSR